MCPCLLRTATLILVGGSTFSCVAQVHVAALNGPQVLQGNSPHIVVSGLAPGAHVTIHAFRRAELFGTQVGQGTQVLAHAHGAFQADDKGVVDTEVVAPSEGTYSGTDALGFLWSGVQLDLTGDPRESVTQMLTFGNASTVVVRVVTQDGKWQETHFELTDGADRVDLQDVVLPNLNGVFARPKTHTGQLRAIVLLHGSEGGSRAQARAAAVRFAQLGYASLAVNYFAWGPWSGTTGLPNALVDIPVEQIATARDWIAKQPGVNAEHIALWGVSKGAEFALVAAAHYPWIDRVVACVPSSVVWSGFGRGPKPGEVFSSWSIDGKGLPYIPYDNYDDALQRRYSAAFVHLRSFEEASLRQRSAARIPIENSKADLLLLAAEKDVVWPSARMARQLQATLDDARYPHDYSVIVFPNASHFICGTGEGPTRINPVHKPEGDDPGPEADARANASSWQKTQDFLKRP